MGQGEGLVVQDLVAELARVAEEGVEVGVEELLHLQREPGLQQPRHAAQPPQAPGNVAACNMQSPSNLFFHCYKIINYLNFPTQETGPSTKSAII